MNDIRALLISDLKFLPCSALILLPHAQCKKVPTLGSNPNSALNSFYDIGSYSGGGFLICKIGPVFTIPTFQGYWEE